MDNKQLCDLIQHYEVAILSSVSADGGIHSRPMIVADVQCSDEIKMQFLVDENASLVDDDKLHEQISVTFSDSKVGVVSLVGEAEVSDSEDRIKNAWNKKLEKWLVGDPKTNDLRLLSLSVKAGKCWLFDESYGTPAYHEIAI